MITQKVCQRIQAVAPISNFYVGDERDKATWIVVYAPEATQEQIAAAQLVIVQFDIAAEDSLVQRIADRLSAAVAYIKSFPWAKTSQTDWQTYFDANLSDAEVDRLVATITTITTAKTALAIMWKRQNAQLDRLTKVEIAIRDIVKPDNPEE